MALPYSWLIGVRYGPRRCLVHVLASLFLVKSKVGGWRGESRALALIRSRQLIHLTTQPLKDVFAVFEAIFTASFSAGRLFTYVGDYSRAIRSFKAIQVCSGIFSRFPRLTCWPGHRCGCNASLNMRPAMLPW